MKYLMTLLVLVFIASPAMAQWHGGYWHGGGWHDGWHGGGWHDGWRGGGWHGWPWRWGGGWNNNCWWWDGYQWRSRC